MISQRLDRLTVALAASLLATQLAPIVQMTRMRDRFSVPAIVLHWAIAGLLMFNIWLGWRYGATRGLAHFNILQLHKPHSVLWIEDAE